MVDLDEAIVARFESHGESFEILIDPKVVQKMKDGKEVDLLDNMVIDTIFKNAKKGTRAPEEKIKEIFGTVDALEVAKTIAKGKSMASEEIALNDHLIENGLEVVETDLGELIVQLADEAPSHVTAPALHRSLEDTAKLLIEKKVLAADVGSLRPRERFYVERLMHSQQLVVVGRELEQREHADRPRPRRHEPVPAGVRGPLPPVRRHARRPRADPKGLRRPEPHLLFLQL